MHRVVRPCAPGLRTARLRLEPLRVEHADEAAAALAGTALHHRTGEHPATSGEPRERCARQGAGRSPDGRQGRLTGTLRERGSARLVATVRATTGRARAATRRSR